MFGFWNIKIFSLDWKCWNEIFCHFWIEIFWNFLFYKKFEENMLKYQNFLLDGISDFHSILLMTVEVTNMQHCLCRKEVIVIKQTKNPESDVSENGRCEISLNVKIMGTRFSYFHTVKCHTGLWGGGTIFPVTSFKNSRYLTFLLKK